MNIFELPSDLHNSIKNSPWYFTDSEDWSEVFKDAPEQSFKKNQIVFCQEETLSFVYLVKEGRVRTSISDDKGQEKTVLIYSEGTIIGGESAVIRSPYLVTAITNNDCRLARIPYERFIQKIEESHRLSIKMSHYLAEMFMRVTYQLKEISFLNSDERVIAHLLKLADRFGRQTEGGVKISIPFTHQEMADLIAVSRVSVSRIMSMLSKEGILERKNGFFYIKDKEALLKIYMSSE
ncbi:Crp/Fnr family transcriptional regulator [Siminovitchia sediminis]|uniref:Crp/Fnr family transcriptional regulator n=1 Tax=Siminovitchia sediminis TaxID=1274353 RepID=A0ABW4KNL8_9BACI